MNKKGILKYGLIGMAVAGIGAAMYPFAASLFPSAKAINDSVVIVDVPPLKPGIVYSINIKGVNLFLLKPDQIQLNSIKELNDHVWKTNSNSFVPELGIFAYWSISPRGQCYLEHKPPQQSMLLEWNKNAKWLGGYWDNLCEVSYDYSGRAIKTYGFTYNGYNSYKNNLISPKVIYESHRKLYVSILRR